MHGDVRRSLNRNWEPGVHGMCSLDDLDPERTGCAIDDLDPAGAWEYAACYRNRAGTGMCHAYPNFDSGRARAVHLTFGSAEGSCDIDRP